MSNRLEELKEGTFRVAKWNERTHQEDKKTLQKMFDDYDVIVIRAAGNTDIAYTTKLLAILHGEIEKVTLQAKLIDCRGGVQKACISFCVYPMTRLSYEIVSDDEGVGF